MTSGITNSQGWEILKSLAKSAGIDGVLGAEDIEKVMESADIDGDGIISYNEFTSQAQKTIDTIEDEYLQAIEDFTNSVSVEKGAESSNTDTNEVDTGFSNSNVPANSSGQNFSPQAAANGGQTQITQSVNPVSLTGNEDMETLEAGRSETWLHYNKKEQSNRHRILTLQ